MTEIPSYLIQQVKEGKVVLLLGSGASCEATNTSGKKPPKGQELAKFLATKFLGGKHADLPLDQVSEYAISESSLYEVQEEIRTLFESFIPTEAHKLMTTFRWEGIATTNYDRLVEKAYDMASKPIQKPLPFIGSKDRVLDGIRNPNSVLLLKLHGCITRINDPTCPLILSIDQYVQYKQGRKQIFDKLFEWARERPILFIGQSLRDPDLRTLLLEIDNHSRNEHPRYYAVSPGLDDIQNRFWETKKVTCIDATFSDFMQSLDSKISTPFRDLSVDYSTFTHPIEKRFPECGTAISERLKQFLDVEVDYVKECTDESPVDPKRFYRGFTEGWSGIEQNLDVARRLADEILSDMVLDEPSGPSSGTKFALLTAHAGAGKSILLKRMAWDAAHDYDRLCLFLKSHGRLDLSALQELYNLSKERIFLFIENAAQHTRELKELLNSRSPEFSYITIIAAERTNQWNMVNEDIKSLVSSAYNLRYLSEKEIDKLLDLLEKHNALGTLKRYSRSDQMNALKERAGRQILVALHEATLGRPFEDIVVDEYRNIPSDDARRIYLSICVLNRLGIWVRAGIISRIYGISFENFKSNFFSPLENVVITKHDPIKRDYIYSARHQHISEMVFDNILRKQEERFDEYIRCFKALNIAYETDRVAFQKMIRANSLIEMFTNPDLIRTLFFEAEDQVGEDAYLLQQMAIFEMNKCDNLIQAEKLLKQAQSMKPYSNTIKHSLAEVQLKLATNAVIPLQRERYLDKAEEIVSDLTQQRSVDSHPYHTRCKIFLLRLRVALEEEDDVSSSTVERLARTFEEHLSRGLQRFPDDSHLLDAESQFARLLADSERALKALEHAFEANKRNSWFAIRLSQAYKVNNQQDKARTVIIRALEANSNSRELHFAYAKLALTSDNPDSDDLIYHLRRSYSPGDDNYEAQLLHGRQLFLSGQSEEARSIFQRLGNVRIDPESKNQIRYRDEREFQGTVSKLEYSYAWIQRDGTGDYIFAHSINISEEIWELLERDIRVNFKFGFTMKGPSVYEIWL